MEFLEIVSVFPGRNNGFFHSTIDAGICCGRVFLYCSVFDDCFYYRPKNDIWGSGIRLAIFGVYYIDDQRSAVFLYGYFGTVSREDIYGGKKETHIPGKGAVLTGKSLGTQVICRQFFIL